MDQRKILSNKAECPYCHDIIESKSRHDFVHCRCRNIFVDGGKDYLRRGYTKKEPIERSTFEMGLYHISQTAVNGYDTFDSAVVIAESENDARKTHPGGSSFGQDYGVWATSPEDVTATLIGTALPGSKAGVVCASFNAG